MKIQSFSLILVLLFPVLGFAEPAQPATPPTDKGYPSVADNMQAMDQDHDGIITSEEISHFLQSQRGRGYKQGVLDELIRVSNSRSCGSPFTRSTY